MRRLILMFVSAVFILALVGCSSKGATETLPPSEFSHDQAMSYEQNYWSNYLLMRKATETIKRDSKTIELENADFESISSKFSTTSAYLEKSKQTFKNSNTFEGIRFDSQKAG